MKRFARSILVAMFFMVATGYAQPFDCLSGTVDLGENGTPATVLAINGTDGGPMHVVTVEVDKPVSVFMDLPPSGPNPAKFALYVWLGRPTVGTVTPQPAQLGDMCFPTPLTGGVPQPKKIWNNIGRYPQLGYPTYPSNPAPSTVFSKPSGLSSLLAVTFQGLILDNGSAANKPASITNAVILEVIDPVQGMALIPAGEFEMGCHPSSIPCPAFELPLHLVYLGAFFIDVYAVTNQSYAEALNWAWSQGGLIQVTDGVVHKDGDTSTVYCDTTISSAYSGITWNGSTFGVVAGKEDHPMLMVTWYGAAAYSNWRSGMEGRSPSYDTTTWECDFDADGYRLPTEAEWECAARGGEYAPYYAYPWGNSIDGSNANYWDSGDPYETGPYPWTTPVGYFDGAQTPPGVDMANGYGLYDMAGNVWEWCNDWYSDTYYESSPYSDPRGPESGTTRAQRGGSWYVDDSQLRCSYRLGILPFYRNATIGFRLALD